MSLSPSQLPNEQFPRAFELDDEPGILEDIPPSKRRRLSEIRAMFPSPSPSRSVDGETFIGESPEEEDTTYRSDPRAAVAKTRVDPFSRHEFDSDPACQAILHHCELSQRHTRDVADLGSCLGHAESHGRADHGYEFSPVGLGV